MFEKKIKEEKIILITARTKCLKKWSDFEVGTEYDFEVISYKKQHWVRVHFNDKEFERMELKDFAEHFK